MYDCEHFRQVIQERPSPGLDEVELAALEAHLGICEACRRLLVETSFTAALLEETAPVPPPPADLAAQISSAVLTQMRFQQRPLHQRALGSPAFFATCASLLCGAIICLLAIWRISVVPTPDFTAVPVPGGGDGKYTRFVVPTRALSWHFDWQHVVKKLEAALEWGNPQPCASLVEYQGRPRTVVVGADRGSRMETRPLLATPNTSRPPPP